MPALIIIYCIVANSYLTFNLRSSVTTAKVEAGLSNIPLANTSAEGPGAGADAGVSWKYTGASAGVHFGEAKAGPFGVHAGVKFGAGIRNGIPELDLGPVTVPAC